MESKWREVLQKVERGELSPEEGARLMAQATREMPMEPAPEAAAALPDVEPAQPHPQPEAEVVEDFSSVYAFWKNWWILPLSAGALIFVLGASLASWATSANLGFWMVCSIFPLLIGLGVILLSFWSRTARWLHVRVRESGGARATRVAISMPIPTQTVGWLMKLLGRYIPGLREQPQVYHMLPEMMAALDESGGPLVVEVNEKNGDEVRVYIM